MIRLHIFLLQVAVITLSMLQICVIFYDLNGKVMMEYIGATGTPITSDPVPIEDGIDFHFILGFAIDADPSGQTQNGIGTFSPYWVDTLTPASVAAIKAKHSNVKALASLSGWSLGQKVIRWYDPVEPQIWISNAFSSLRSIAIKYHLDGIDIDYENLPKHKLNFCLLHRGAHYHVEEPKCYIHSYQCTLLHHCYTLYRIMEVSSTMLTTNSILISYEVNGRGIQGDAFFEALDLLKENGFEVNGEMIFSADASSTNNYYYERKSQAFLLNSTKGPLQLVSEQFRSYNG
uniref:GH18 domain-containing protein n=1 Tax=Quercus lobata TaxID=97700 RepID=A0A7N2LYN5_QUELO